MGRGRGLGGRVDHRCVRAAMAGDRTLTLNDRASGCSMAADAAARATATLDDGSLAAGNDGSLAGARRRSVLRWNATAIYRAAWTTVDRETAIGRSAAADRSAAAERSTFLTEDAALGSGAGSTGQGAATVGADACTGPTGQAAATVGAGPASKRATRSVGRGTAASPRGGGPASLSPQTSATRKGGSRRLRCCVGSEPVVAAQHAGAAFATDTQSCGPVGTRLTGDTDAA